MGGRRAFRAVLDGLLGGVGLSALPARHGHRDRAAVGRRAPADRARPKLLLDAPELLLLDEPTNHLDVEGVAWLAAHLAARRGSMLVVTHDRWFLDAVCTATWEVADEAVHQYDGGYAAYVLARAERDRQEAARDDRRRAAGAQGARLAAARAAGADGEAEVPHRGRERADRRRARRSRDRAELLRFATARLGDKVLEAVDVTWRSAASRCCAA